MKNKMTHNELVWDLANTFDLSMNSVFVESYMGSAVGNNGVPIPDVFVMNKSYGKPNIRIYEVKASTEDLRGDIRRMKWEKYLPYCDRMFFALGPNVNGWEDLLKDMRCGIMVRNENGWKVKRVSPKLERRPLSEDVLLALLICGRQVLKSSKYDRMNDMKLRLLSDDLSKAMYLFSSKIMLRAREVSEKERSLKNIKSDTRVLVLNELKAALGVDLNVWGSHNVEGFLDEVVVRPVSALFRERLDKLMEVISGENINE